VGPIGRAVAGRPPFGPIVRLDADALHREQLVTLARSPRKPSVGGRVLFATMDAAYGRARTLERFRVLELVAPVPYQAWENVGLFAMVHTARQRIYPRVVPYIPHGLRWHATGRSTARKRV
jgi:ubiquinol oxidase